MCGFVAAVGRRESPRTMAEMLDAVASRGPDAAATRSSDWFSVSACRLAVVALHEGAQPTVSADGRTTLVFNGELYDYPDRVVDLHHRTGHVATSETDLLLTAFLELGPGYLDALIGDFAVAVFDERTRECHLWRDAAGVKPLYYTQVASGLTLVASETRGLLAHPGFQPEWDEVALAERQVLTFWAVDRTPFRGVRQVPPGHRLTIRHGRPGQPKPLPPPQVPGSHDCGEPLRLADAVLSQAVERQVRHTDVRPVIVALSGGVDSSLLAAFARRCSDHVPAITLCTGRGEPDAQYAALVAASLGMPHHVRVVTPDDIRRVYPQVVLAQPAVGGFLAYLLAETMGRVAPGSKVLMCGEGADETFLGYVVHRRPAAFAAAARRQLAAVPPRLVEQSPLLQRVRNWSLPAGRSVTHEVFAMFVRDQLVNRHLLPFDHSTMARGVECRVPYLDRAVRELAGSVPAEAHLADGTGKALLRRLLPAALGADTGHAVLTRSRSPGYRATSAARSQVHAQLASRLSASPLAASPLARFARNNEELLWLGATQAVHMRRRGVLDGVTFDDLVDEALADCGP